MMRKRLETLSDEELVGLFEKAAHEQGLAVRQSDLRAVNAAYRRRDAVYEELASRGEEARAMLAPLMDHNDPAVRLYTAKRMKDLFPERVRTTLENIVKYEALPFAGAAGMSLDHFESESGSGSNFRKEVP